MYTWLFSCDMWPNKYRSMISWSYGQKKVTMTHWDTWEGSLMVILWITSLHLLKIFDCKYNTEIKVPFFGDDLLVSHDLVPDWSHYFDSSAQLWAPTLPALGKAELSQALATLLVSSLNVAQSYLNVKVFSVHIHCHLLASLNIRKRDCVTPQIYKSTMWHHCKMLSPTTTGIHLSFIEWHSGI